jgi:large subunit ribosomal protein L54
MICRTCLRASRALPTRRFLSTTRPSLNATPISAASQPTPRQASDSHAPPAATSTSAAQPFSAPLTPAPTPALEKNAAKASEKKAAPLIKSSVPAGTPLKGLNFEKAKQDPLAKADDEYPAWLWTILQRQEDKGEVGVLGDLFCTSPSP